CGPSGIEYLADSPLRPRNREGLDLLWEHRKSRERTAGNRPDPVLRHAGPGGSDVYPGTSCPSGNLGSDPGDRASPGHPVSLPAGGHRMGEQLFFEKNMEALLWIAQPAAGFQIG